MIARRRRYFRGQASNPQQRHLPDARIHVLLLRANNLGFRAKNLRQEISADDELTTARTGALPVNRRRFLSTAPLERGKPSVVLPRERR